MQTGLLPIPVAVVVGASSGIGAALARRLAAAGYRVALVARRADALNQVAEAIAAEHGAESVLALPHDVRQYDQAPALLQQVLQRWGRLDVVVYAAGVLHPVTLEEYAWEKDREMLEVNLLGAVAWLGAAADLLQAAGAGYLVGLSSVAGDRGRAKNPAYQASKAGLSNYLESLSHRLARHGVHVLTVKPGFVDTPMLARAGGGRLWVVSPEQVAEDIVRALRRRRGGVLYTPARWRWVMLVIKHLPGWLLRRLPL